MAMLMAHEGRSPSVHPTAYVAPSAALCGDVRVGAGCRVLFGAVLTVEGGPVELGEGCIVMENALLRGTRRDPLVLGWQVLVGPTSYLTGCRIEDEVFLATESRIFNGAWLGTRIDRIAADTPYCSGKHKRHGVSVQVLIALVGGQLLWASSAPSGSTHDLITSRTHGIVEALAKADLRCWADAAYQGAGGSTPVPFRGRRLEPWQRRHNSTHAKTRCLGKQTMVTLKGRRLLRKLRCSTNRITTIVRAFLVLHHAGA
ncbi:hypothetical protein GCM10010249_59330 [Streptomyces roseolilacinus]|uniref:DDE Tnp4 domain-containing protein n=1 Tax=Streptomyces roseolilacinus TaxID=66904 RepID=A0A918EMH4_9ACTN|nr:hypothetical protein GCM10010249_59330 [Streptomyces roseolilacinus]